MEKPLGRNLRSGLRELTSDTGKEVFYYNLNWTRRQERRPHASRQHHSKDSSHSTSVHGLAIGSIIMSFVFFQMVVVETSPRTNCII